MGIVHLPTAERTKADYIVISQYVDLKHWILCSYGCTISTKLLGVTFRTFRNHVRCKRPSHIVLRYQVHITECESRAAWRFGPEKKWKRRLQSLQN